jgi:hypothetical protein
MISGQCCRHVLSTDSCDDTPVSRDYKLTPQISRKSPARIFYGQFCYFLLLLHKHSLKESKESEVKPELNRPYKYIWSDGVVCMV